MPTTLQMSARLTDISATLSFITPPPAPAYKSYTPGIHRDLRAVESSIHPEIYSRNFIRHFKPAKDVTTGIQEYVSEFDSAFGSMVHTAFGKHQPIKLRPDDIHLLIVQGFSRFIQKYSEDFRKLFVTYQAKKKITVRLNDINDIESWEQMPSLFAANIRQFIKTPETADLLMQDYSETTETDRTVIQFKIADTDEYDRRPIMVVTRLRGS
jgi:hypothetical protein